ncbi:MAG: hypothetical protein QOI10_21 [Solirubrobacterales bacterium]|jgi:hypothetical protein|nr:hypothetical protein [Solirubrobacterales bacterium]
MGLLPDISSGDGTRGGRGPFLRLLAVAALCAGAVAAPAIGHGLRPNPANSPRLLSEPIDAERYDAGRSCRDEVPPGMKALERWLEHNVRGESWGILRCEKWGHHECSLHCEGRAIDWRLDAGIAKERRAAHRLIDSLLATDRDGNERALARRMGIQGLIFDCHAWWAGMSEMGPYSYCYKRNGELRHNLDRTQAHRNHVHIELNWDGARKRTSFWRGRGSR